MSDASSISWLFVPADRPDRFEKAAASGAEETILDLEDAVAPDAKPAARAHAAAWLSSGGRGWVRINAHGTPWHEDDLDALASLPGLSGVVVPKAEDPGALARIADRPVPLHVLALVETALGVRRLDGICAVPGVGRLAFGSIDFALDIDAQESDEAMLHARSELVLASRAAGLPAPIDGVSIEFRAPAVVEAAARRARALGFGGKLCIHPAQVAVVRRAFRPDPAELEWARRVAAVVGGAGVAVLDGRMIDRPLLLRAERILARAGEGRAAARPAPGASRR